MDHFKANKASKLTRGQRGKEGEDLLNQKPAPLVTENVVVAAAHNEDDCFLRYLLERDPRPPVTQAVLRAAMASHNCRRKVGDLKSFGYNVEEIVLEEEVVIAVARNNSKDDLEFILEQDPRRTITEAVRRAAEEKGTSFNLLFFPTFFFQVLTEQQLNDRLRREGVKTHKERVEDLNRYLSTLSEHHDMYVYVLAARGLPEMLTMLGPKSDRDNEVQCAVYTLHLKSHEVVRTTLTANVNALLRRNVASPGEVRGMFKPMYTQVMMDQVQCSLDQLLLGYKHAIHLINSDYLDLNK